MAKVARAGVVGLAAGYAGAFLEGDGAQGGVVEAAGDGAAQFVKCVGRCETADGEAARFFVGIEAEGEV